MIILKHRPNNNKTLQSFNSFKPDKPSVNIQKQDEWIKAGEKKKKKRKNMNKGENYVKTAGTCIMTDFQD